MTGPSGRARELASRIAAAEAGAAADPGALAAATSRAYARFHDHMARIVSGAGFRALASRAIGRARDDYAFLDGLRPSSRDPSRLHGLDGLFGGCDAADAHAALESVLAHVIDLMFTFLGPTMTVRLIREAWPGLDGTGSPERSKGSR